MRSNLSEVRQNSGPEVDLSYRHAFLEKFPDHIDTDWLETRHNSGPQVDLFSI